MSVLLPPTSIAFTCLARRSMLEPAAMATNSNLSGNSEMMSRVWVPMEPVLPSRENLCNRVRGDHVSRLNSHNRFIAYLENDQYLRSRSFLNFRGHDAHIPGRGHRRATSRISDDCARTGQPRRTVAQGTRALHIEGHRKYTSSLGQERRGHELNECEKSPQFHSRAFDSR